MASNSLNVGKVVEAEVVSTLKQSELSQALKETGIGSNQINLMLARAEQQKAGPQI